MLDINIEFLSKDSISFVDNSDYDVFTNTINFSKLEIYYPFDSTTSLETITLYDPINLEGLVTALGDDVIISDISSTLNDGIYRIVYTITDVEDIDYYTEFYVFKKNNLLECKTNLMKQLYLEEDKCIDKCEIVTIQLGIEVVEENLQEPEDIRDILNYILDKCNICKC